MNDILSLAFNLTSWEGWVVTILFIMLLNKLNEKLKTKMLFKQLDGIMDNVVGIPAGFIPNAK